jgi:hypothetical protein
VGEGEGLGGSGEWEVVIGKWGGENGELGLKKPSGWARAWEARLIFQEIL